MRKNSDALNQEHYNKEITPVTISYNYMEPTSQVSSGAAGFRNIAPDICIKIFTLKIKVIKNMKY